MSPIVTVRLREQDARDAAAGKPEALRRAQRAIGEELGRRAQRQERRPARSGKVPLRTPARPKPASGAWGTKALRWEVWERSGGRCECGCGRRITWDGGLKFNMDHFLGRARAPQSPENCWALARDCDTRRTLNQPDREHWLQVFLLHLEQHGFGSSETAKGIRDELASAEALREAQRHAARAAAQAVETVEDLADRAQRAEGASDGD